MKQFCTCMLLFFYSMIPAQERWVQGIMDNFNEQTDCWNAGDLVCYMQAYAAAEEIQTISRAGVTKGYEAILLQYQTYYTPERMGTLHFDNMEFHRINNNYYYVVGRFNLTYDKVENNRSGYFSVLMKRIKGKWYIVSDHSS